MITVQSPSKFIVLYWGFDISPPFSKKLCPHHTILLLCDNLQYIQTARHGETQRNEYAPWQT
jgi:hypothetical protein